MNKRSNLALSAVVLVGVVAAATVIIRDQVTAAESFGEPCADVTMIAVPGSYETKEGANPNHAVGMLQHATNPVRARQSSKQLRVHYIGYPSTIFLDYFSSKDKGYQATWSTLRQYGLDCVDTKFVLIGYSQGAHVVGDLTATIAAERAPVRPNRILGIFLLADPALDGGFSRLIGVDSSLGGAAGSRSNFGELSDRVYELCANADPICDVEPNPFALPQLAILKSGPHVEYNSAFVPGTKVAFTDWIAGRLKVLLGVDGALPPPAPEAKPVAPTKPVPAPTTRGADVPPPVRTTTTQPAPVVPPPAPSPVTHYDCFNDNSNIGHWIPPGTYWENEFIAAGSVISHGWVLVGAHEDGKDHRGRVSIYTASGRSGALLAETQVVARGYDGENFAFGTPIRVNPGQRLWIVVSGIGGFTAYDNRQGCFIARIYGTT